jgi:L-threonylcarbamoyladenylate synthase
MTRIIRVDPKRPQESLIEQAASVIRSGGLVAFPTETVYGLGADAMSEQAVRKIFEAKQRPADNPLIVHISSRQMLSTVADCVSSKAEVLIEKFWPGPLTLVFKRKPEVAPSVSAGLPTVAVRMPKNKIALALIHASATPIAAPSANRSGRPSPTTAEHVARDLEGRIDLILDGGTTDIGIESTVLDLTTDPPVILRPGWVTSEMLAETVGPLGGAASEKELRRSPGTRHRHYSPRARLVLIEQGATESISNLCAQLLKIHRVGFIGHTQIQISDSRFYSITLDNDAGDYARSIYAALRELDEKHADVILVEGISDLGQGAAVMDRLRRAASEIIKPIEQV